MAISSDLLLSIYQSRAPVRTGAAALGGAAQKKTVPTAPWDKGSTAPQAPELVKSVLGGRKFIQPDDIKLDVKNPSDDYRKMFSVFQGLNALNALAERAGTKGVTSFEMDQLERRFAAGMKEVDSFLETMKLDQVRLVRGESMTTAKTEAGVKRDRSEYVTGMVHEGRMDEASPALSGDVRFNISAKKPDGSVIDVAIDLAEMGGETRSFGNFINHVNTKLGEAGVLTRLTREKLSSEPRTAMIGGKSVELGPAVDRWAMKVVGVETEKISFGAPQAADAVYVAQSIGVDDEKTGAASARQLLKFQTDQVAPGGAPPAAAQPEGEANWVEGRAFARTLGPEVATVRATATGADGSVYVLGDVTGKIDGQGIQGDRDVALLKYDAAGKLLFTRTLGAADEAQGYALAVSAEGKVAVAGSVTGALGGVETSLDAKATDGFVTLFDADGQEMWTRRRGAVLDDEARAVAFGDDGTVFVGGRARSAVPGAAAEGGWDGYLQSFSGTDGAALSARQFGTTGDDGVSAIAVSGSKVVVAGGENGNGVLRSFDVGAAGELTADSVRNLGALDGGAIAAVAFDEAGQVIVAGSTRNGALSGGAVNTAHSGGRDGFVAKLSGDLAAAGTDRISYFGGAGDDSVTALAVRNGQAYIAGSSDGALPGSTLQGKSDGFLVRMDAATGAVGWSRRFAGQDGQAAPTSIAVAAEGASVLDRLGLPKGTLDYTSSKQVVAATSAREGDFFYVKTKEGARGVQVKIAADDTLKSLAQKINRALGFNARAEVVKDGEYERIQIKPRTERVLVEIAPGQGGKDALSSLGLSEGVVRHAKYNVTSKEDEATETPRKIYAMKLDRNLNLSNEIEIKHAQAELQGAIVAIRSAYRDLQRGSRPEAAKPVTGEAPAYLKGQIANYQAALSRLGG